MSKNKSDPLDHKEAETQQGAEKIARPFESLREIVGIISAGAGIFAVILYLAGRTFANGYFTAMNIPDFQVSFSIWEYGEVAWTPLLLFSAGVMVTVSLFGSVIFTIRDWASPYIARLWDRLKKRRNSKRSVFEFPPLKKDTKRWYALTRVAIFILTTIPILYWGLFRVRDFGLKTGQFNVLENSARVEIIATTPMALDDNQLAPTKASGQDFFVYQGFHLLTVNNGKYYLFKDLDQEMCKPVKVYVIEARESLQVNILPAMSLKDQCDKKAILFPVLSSTPTATP